MAQKVEFPKIGFQGVEGAYSHQAAKQIFPDADYHPFFSFEDLLDATQDVGQNVGQAKQIDYAVIPIENSTGGRVAEFHHLLRDTDLRIVQEFFMPIKHFLLAKKGVAMGDISHVLSHPQALAQCRNFLRQAKLSSVAHVDTAGSAKEISLLDSGADNRAAVASSLAAEIYGLDIVAENIQDNHDNTTRFLVMTRQEMAEIPVLSDDDSDAANQYITSMVYQLRSVPAALYKTLGGFASAGINLIKLESYIPMGDMGEAWFYVESLSHPDTPLMQEALRELQFYTHELRILGVYQASDWRG
ncbi:MAG: prephenate dehydratase [Alphaproteobacteria bacterium]|nr:prephenate dehydratase [Alphaproteobacteria bacterium]